MMIDIGAVQNLITQKILNPDVQINKQNVLKLTGNYDLPLYTLGYVQSSLVYFKFRLSRVVRLVYYKFPAPLRATLFHCHVPL